MRLPPLRFTTKRMMIAVAVAGVGTWALTEYQRNGTYYAAGWWDAELELWRGEASYLFGPSSGSAATTAVTSIGTRGFPVRGLSCCVIRTSDSEWVKGHNDHIAQYIRWHGLPTNTFKPWERELFDLYRYFEVRSRTNVPTRLLADGPAVVSRATGGTACDWSRGANDARISYNSREIGHHRRELRAPSTLRSLREGRLRPALGTRGISFWRHSVGLRQERTLRGIRPEDRPTPACDESWHEWKRRDERTKSKPLPEYRSPIATDD